MRRAHAIIILTLLVVLPVRAAQPKATLVPIGLGYARTCVNAGIFRRNSVITHGETQYAAYYDPHGRVVLAKRKLGSGRWQKRVTQYRGNVRDAHNSISITVDGEGTVITTESCFLNKNRNPGWSKQEIEAELCRTLGTEKVIWIPGDVKETETDGHIDGIAAFVEPGVVLVEVNPDKTDPHYSVGQENMAALKDQTDARGRKLQLEFIDEGIYHKDVWNGGCSSYINSYLANGAVIVPGYEYDRDQAAVETYRRLYPEKEVVQVQINNIAVGGGGVHCITQQQPLPM